MTKNILTAVEITKSFGGLRALDGVSLAVKEKSITMIIGPNGSGKTTFINIITGVLKPDKGVVKFDGVNITNWPPNKIYELGVVRTFQIPMPFSKLTVLENLLVAYRGHKGESFLKAPIKSLWIRDERKAVEKAFKIIKLLNLDSVWDEQAYKLSGGQMKLLEIGRALMSDPKLIVMDEPMAGVNPALAHTILSRLSDLRKNLGVTLLIVEHRLEIALRYIDYVYAFSNGRVVGEGSPDKVVSDPKVIESYIGV